MRRRVLIVSILLMLSVLVVQRLTAPNSPPRVSIDSRYLCAALAAYIPAEELTCADCTYAAVDKSHRLPASYVPPVMPVLLTGGGSLVPEAAIALTDLFAEARQRKLAPRITSAYRSYEDQARTFAAWFRQELSRTHNLDRAFDNASRYSALPGFSEHQLGTAVDLNCDGCAPFDREDSRNIALWKFLEDEGYRFGFAISYPRNVEALTGYQYEPWHIRYVGKEYAAALFAQNYLDGNGVCLSAFLRAQAHP
jgi:D-alanyl-D-alanine carboxypeptidase